MTSIIEKMGGSIREIHGEYKKETKFLEIKLIISDKRNTLDEIPNRPDTTEEKTRELRYLIIENIQVPGWLSH